MDSRQVSSALVSSLSERSYGPAKPGKIGNKTTASHDSSEEIIAKSSDSSVKQQHARRLPPELKRRKESLPLLAPSNQVQKRSNISAPQRSKGDKTNQRIQGRTSAPPVLAPRSSSLESKPANQSNVHRSKALEGAKTSTPTLQPKKHEGASAAGTTKSKSWDSMHASIRKMALAKDTSMDAIKKIEELYREDHFGKVPDKTGITLGKITPISHIETSQEQNGEYFWRVLELYKLNETDEVIKRMEKRIETIRDFERDDHKFYAGDDMVKLMISRLTPSQRNLLRRNFPLLYWNTTIRDDINWLFFDTIISSTTESHSEQKKIMQMIIDAPVERRQEVRDKIMDKAHSKMSAEQRNELKKICKSRHDELVNSRLPTLHVLIRQRNEEAMMGYINTVLLHAPREERVRLLLARCDTKKGRETGDPSFFTLAHSGSAQMMGAYLARILKTKKLTIEQKWDVLGAVGQDGCTSAFHLMMSAGDWPRVERFLLEIFKFQAGRTDCLDTRIDAPFGVFSTHPRSECTDYTMVAMLAALMRAPITDHTRTPGFRSAYDTALDNGKKDCARKFKEVIMHKYNTGYFFEHHRSRMTTRYLLDNSRPTFAQKDAKNASLIAEAPLYNFRKSLTTEALPPKDRDEALMDEADFKKYINERIMNRLKEFPELATLTPEQNHFAHKQRTANYTYPIVDRQTREINAKLRREEKRRKSSWSFSRKSVQDPAMPVSPTLSNSPNLYKTKYIRRVSQSLPTINSLGAIGMPTPSPAPATSPEKAAPNKRSDSPSSPYKGDQQRLIDASEGA